MNVHTEWILRFYLKSSDQDQIVGELKRAKLNIFELQHYHCIQNLEVNENK